MIYTIEIDMDAKCAECGQLGATKNTLCFKCIAKALRPSSRMKSEAGKTLQQHFDKKYRISKKRKAKP
jgi:ribosomal protein L40E